MCEETGSIGRCSNIPADVSGITSCGVLCVLWVISLWETKQWYTWAGGSRWKCLVAWKAASVERKHWGSWSCWITKGRNKAQQCREHSGVWHKHRAGEGSAGLGEAWGQHSREQNPPLGLSSTWHCCQAKSFSAVSDCTDLVWQQRDGDNVGCHAKSVLVPLSLAWYKSERFHDPGVLFWVGN